MCCVACSISLHGIFTLVRAQKSFFFFLIFESAIKEDGIEIWNVIGKGTMHPIPASTISHQNQELTI